MKIFPEKNNIQRSEEELRLQPFTSLAVIPVILIVVAGITYTCVYSDSIFELRSHAWLSGAISLPFIVFFAIIWRKESRRPFSLRARRVAWRGMFYAYVTVAAAIVLMAIFLHVPVKNRVSLMASLGMSLPMGAILYQLIRTK